jgi:neutral ceramidase
MRFALSVLAILGTVAGLSAEEKPVFRAGAFAMDVTPLKYPVSVNGSFTDQQATKANDPLHARCLVLDDGKTKLAIVVVDNCLMSRELIENAKGLAEKATKIPVDHMLISATHTHMAPTVIATFGSPVNVDYVEFLTQKIADGIAKANANLAPAEWARGSVAEPSLLFNRRWKMKPGVLNKDPFGRTTDLVRMNPGHQLPDMLEPAGPIDPELSFLAVRTLKGRPIALLGNYSLHYVGDFPALSADYFGVFSELVGPPEAKSDDSPKFVGMLSNGTSGDVNNIDFKNAPLKTKVGERCRTVAGVLAGHVAKLMPTLKFSSDCSLAVAEQELELKVRKPDESDLLRASEMIQKLGARQASTSEEVYAGETLAIQKFPDTMKLKLQALRIGDLGIAAIPCEAFTQIGLDIKKASPLKATFTICLANGYYGYLPTPAQHKLGGYETWRARSSYLEVDASEKIMPVIEKLLKSVQTK